MDPSCTHDPSSNPCSESHQALEDRPLVFNNLSRTEHATHTIIDLYMLPQVHGGCRRFCCECLLVVGLMLPLLGPLLGLCVFVPYFSLLFEEGTIIQPDSPCYGAPTLCGSTFSYDYYFWNITNAEEVRSLPW